MSQDERGLRQGLLPEHFSPGNERASEPRTPNPHRPKTPLSFHRQQQQLQQKSAKRIMASSSSQSSSSISHQLWSMAVHSVLEERRDIERLPRYDGVGDRLTDLVNQHPEFQSHRPTRRRRANQYDSRPTEFRCPPLISRHNLAVLKRKFADLSPDSMAHIVRSIVNLRYANQLSRFLFKSRRPFIKTLKFTIQCTLFLSILMVVASHFLIVQAIRVSIYLFSYLFLMLIDWKEIQERYVPERLWIVLKHLYQFLLWIDTHVLHGHRFRGREWNADEFCYIDPHRRHPFDTKPITLPESTEKTLWDLPPPSVRERGLSLNMQHLLGYARWSRRTVEHMVGINFCYIMLREADLQNQTSRSKKSKKRNERRKLQSPVNEVILEEGAEDDFVFDGTPRLTPERLRQSEEIINISGSPGRERSNTAVTVVVDGTPIDVADRNEVLGDVLGAVKESIEVEVGNSRLLTVVGDDNSKILSHPGSPNESSYQSDTTPNSNASDFAGDLPWFDVGAQIGMRLLNSAHVHRVMSSQETTDRFMDMGRFNQVDDATSGAYSSSDVFSPLSPVFMDSSKRSQARSVGSGSNAKLSKPVNPMWTSPAAAASPVPSIHSEPEASIGYGSPAFPLSQKLVMPNLSPQEGRSKPPLSPKSGTSSQKRDAAFGSVDSDLSSRESSAYPSSHSNISATLEEQLTPPKLNRVGRPSRYGPMVPSRDRRAPFGGRRIRQQLDRDKGRASKSSNLSDATSTQSSDQREPLEPGVKVAVPLFPLCYKIKRQKARVSCSQFQMGTVVRSQRICVGPSSAGNKTNCLAVTVKLDKSYLRNAEFAELTFRVMDEWSSRYMPKHSKVPVGTCVATTFGVGVLVGWRVEDDCHIVRSLWHRRGNGSAHAYLNRDAIHSTIETAVGFEVNTTYGWGDTLAYVDGGRYFTEGRFFVAIKDEGRYQGHVLELHRKDIYSCHGASFLPILEHISEAAHYQIQVDNYQAALREQQYDENQESDGQRLWRSWSSCVDIIWRGFLKAVEEDSDFDEGVNEFMTAIIEFLERLDDPDSDSEEADGATSTCVAGDFEVELVAEGITLDSDEELEQVTEPGFWIVNDILGGVFRPEPSQEEVNGSVDSKGDARGPKEDSGTTYYDKAFSILRILMKTVSIAKADSVEHPHLRLALAICYDFLLFIRTVIRVQKKNSSVHSLQVWQRAFEEIALTFGPIKERLEKIGLGIAQRMEKQGRKAKIRVLQFVDTVVADEKLLFAMEQGEWDQCLLRVEMALIKSKIIQEESLFYYRKTAQYIYDQILSMSDGTSGAAAARNNEKIAVAAQFLQSIASPRRSLLKIFRREDVLELFERILVRVYCREETVSRILTIHASNFHSLRHLRMLKDFSVAGRIWIPLLDAADEEFSWVVSHMPESSKEFMCPLSSLFSLCVAQFHKINAGDLSKDWMDFLMEEDAVRIIQDIDMKLLLALESFARDVREMMVVLPYYPSIDDDILKLMDEVDVDEFLKEAAAAIDDPDNLAQFLREKATIAIERFLNYLPKMSIPVERRDLGDGWVLTCRGEDGSDLTLSDVKIKRENLICQILGGDTLFFPMFGSEAADPLTAATVGVTSPTERPSSGVEEESILDHIRVLLLQAQSYGCWQPGIGGVGQPPSDRYVAAVLHGLPVSSVLNCAIELWRNLEIDDDELLEIAIRDVSFQIQLQQKREEGLVSDGDDEGESLQPMPPRLVSTSTDSLDARMRDSNSFEHARRRFNPRVDPTVLFLEMTNLTLHLDNFMFRIEKAERKSIFDPVFEGRAMVLLRNVSIRLRVECAKERVKRAGGGPDVSSPILQIQELDVGLESMDLKVKDTGFGSEWLLNRAVDVFGDNITKVVEENLKDQILEQSRIAIENLNSYFLVNPNMLLTMLGISMDDLEENVVWV